MGFLTLILKIWLLFLLTFLWEFKIAKVKNMEKKFHIYYFLKKSIFFFKKIKLYSNNNLTNIHQGTDITTSRIEGRSLF